MSNPKFPISSAQLAGDTFQRTRWPVFRDSQERGFLVSFLLKRIETHRVALESCGGDMVPALQGKITEARVLLNLLNQTNITEEKTSVESFLKSYGY